jgi:hypothetical protein
LNFNLTTFNSTIGLRFNSIQIQIQSKRNGIQIGGEGIEHLYMNMVLEKKNLKKINPKKTPLLGNGLNNRL